MKETSKARTAFEDYYLMGPQRSIQKLHVRYQHNPATRPTKNISTLKGWSVAHGWQEQVRQRDKQVADAAMKQILDTATNTGYAVYQKRIHDLGLLALRVFGLMVKEEKGPDTALLREYRGLLADIAAEMGEREKKHRIKVDDWRSQIVEHLRDGKLQPQEVIDELGRDLATELFISSGIRVDASGALIEESRADADIDQVA